jgi:ribonuclease R
VRPGSALDSEARVRGCSVYLPNRAIPMLPHQLSAGMCSLNPDVDRLAMVVALDIDAAGQVVKEQFAAAVIHSHGRLDYPGVAAALSGDLRGSLARYREHLPQLQRLKSLTDRLRARRLLRGALDFDLPEAKVILDEDDPERVRDVVRARGNPEVRDAYRLVEDCMLAANEAVARFFNSRGLDTVYRVHDVPDGERLLAFAALAKGHGMIFDPEAARSPLYLRGFLEKLKGRPMEQALSYLLLRALKKAHYDIVSIGHFGLATPDYLHFTSPIRRYPDLLVHRLLKLRLRREGLPAGAPENRQHPEKQELSRWAQEASAAERRAMEVEREVVDLYRAVLMLDQIGQEFDGTIVGITAFGIFVAIEAPYVEGLIKTERLGGSYVFDAQTVRLLGKGTGKSFSLGDAVRVRIEDVSVTRRKLEFSLAGTVKKAAWAPLAETEAPAPARQGPPKMSPPERLREKAVRGRRIEKDRKARADKGKKPVKDAKKGRKGPAGDPKGRKGPKAAGKGPGRSPGKKKHGAL